MCRRRLLAGVVVGLTAACSSPIPHQPSPSPLRSGASSRSSVASPGTQQPDRADLDCDDSIDSPQRPGDGYEIVLGVVALPTAGATAALQTARDSGPPVRYFAKRGLVVKTDRSFDLTVVGPAGLDGTLGWGNPGRFARTVHVDGCPGTDADGTAGWRAFAGGYETAATGCLTVRVSTTEQTAEQTTEVQIGVGASCPGQSPPPSPSDP